MGIQREWDREAGKRMWEAGRSDAEIAKALGVAHATISYFRKKHWQVATVTVEAAANESEPQEIEDAADIPVSNDIPEEVPVETVPAAAAPLELVTEPEPDPEPESDQKPVPDPKTDTMDAKDLFCALEKATENLTGMDAVMTAQVISYLWKWTDASELHEAKACLDYLIRRNKA